MNRRKWLALTMAQGFGLATRTATAGDNSRRDKRYAPEFYTWRASESRAPGVYRMKIDNRSLEITLAEPQPDALFLPEKVVTKGEGETFQKMLRRQKNRLEVFTVHWIYGLLHGLLTPFVKDDDSGSIWAIVDVKEHTEVWVKDPGVTTTRNGYTFKGERPLTLDYLKLKDFTQAVHPDESTNPYWVEVINGRRWVRQIVLPPHGMDVDYVENFKTPLDRRTILTVAVSVSDHYPRYASPEDVPRWMQQANKNITAVLRSIKLSPPDDGSPDPFLIDPEQKAEAIPVEFPARRR